VGLARGASGRRVFFRRSRCRRPTVDVTRRNRILRVLRLGSGMSYLGFLFLRRKVACTFSDCS
jgi:hypothetical protein